MINLRNVFVFLVVALFIFGCQDSKVPMDSSSGSNDIGKSQFNKPNCDPDVIDFEAIAPGTIVDEVFGAAGTGPISVYAYNPDLSNLFPGNGKANAAVVFDSEDPPGNDVDLGTPNEDFGGEGMGYGGEVGSPYQNDTHLYNILVINEADEFVDRDGNNRIDNSDSPVRHEDDADNMGEYVDFDFSAIGNGNHNTVTINSVTLMDIEREQGEDGTYLELSGPDLPTNLIGIPPTGDNGVVVIDGIGLSGVSLLRVNFNGSGALDAVTYNQGEFRYCWITTGGFQNAGVQSGGKDFTFGGNVGPPPSGSWEVIDHNTGDNFHSNDVHIDSCSVISGTGPGQPGGKKGFQINQAFFSGTGRLNHVDGYPFIGFVIDRGEPSGKNGNQKDEFFIEVYEPGTTTVVFQTQFELDGGNVQIHPCNGNQCQ